MRKLISTILYSLPLCLTAQVVKDYDPAIQRTTNMQYFKPAESHLFTGDCMPFYHNGTFYLYWLLDEGHHAGLGGLGGHQWALSTSEDLKTWKHHPVALGIDEEWEKSICTGSVIAEGDKIYAFYSTRVKEGDRVHEQLSYAMSTDGGITFKKQQPNPFYYAPKECVSRDFRDPRAFKDENGVFHLFISGYMKDPVIQGQGGYLVHLTSTDLKNWSEATPPLTGQPDVPECSDYFKWNDWYYLIYGQGGRTYYLKSKEALGTWEYPTSQPMVERWSNVGKTAEFKGGRRIVATYMNYKKDNKDSDGPIWGGSVLLRELFQNKKSGLLTVGYLPEVAPAMEPIATREIKITGSGKEVSFKNGALSIQTPNGLNTAVLPGLPSQYRITMTIEPQGNYDELGLFLRATDKNKKGYKLGINPNKQHVSLHESYIESVTDLRKPISLNIIVMDDLIDVYINNQRCIVNRLAEQKGDNIIFFVKNGSAVIKDIKLYHIK